MHVVWSCDAGPSDFEGNPVAGNTIYKNRRIFEKAVKICWNFKFRVILLEEAEFCSSVFALGQRRYRSAVSFGP